MLAADTLFGLPAHPLVVHAAVILLPIAAISLIVGAAIPKARRIYAPIVFAVALFATIAVFMAQESGEALEGEVDETELVEADRQMLTRSHEGEDHAADLDTLADTRSVGGVQVDPVEPLTTPS